MRRPLRATNDGVGGQEGVSCKVGSECVERPPVKFFYEEIEGASEAKFLWKKRPEFETHWSQTKEASNSIDSIP